MAIDMREFGRSMEQFAPVFQMLFQRKMEEERVQRWLQKTLAEYSAWGKEQERQKGIGYKYSELQRLGKIIAKSVKGLDRPGMEYIKRARGFGIPLPADIGAISPEAEAGALAPYEKAAPTISDWLRGDEEIPSEEKITAITRLLGTGKVSELLGKRRKEVVGTEERGLKGRGLDIKEEKARLGWAKLKAKKEEEKKPSKKDERRLEILDKKEKELQKQLEDLSIEGMEAGEEESIAASIGSIRKEKMALLDKMEASLNMEKIQRVLSKLSAAGITARGMEQYKEAFMKKEDLSEGEYQYIKANL